VEVPDLGSSSVWNLDYHVSVVDKVKVSVIWQLGDNIEISLNVKTESFIELSLSWFSLPFINIDNIPLLVDLSMFVINLDVSVFSIYSSLDI
jgi:hypothetical protein